jgi:hypothetical protein
MSNAKIENQRFAELRTGENGRLQATWQLSDTKLIDAVRIALPPTHRVPIVFVPGIMGSNLCDLHGEAVWLLNSVRGVPAGLAAKWANKEAGVRQKVLHPERTKVYGSGNVPKDRVALGYSRQDYLERGWGEVSEASYHKFLIWLEDKMNSERNPANWDDFLHTSLALQPTIGEKIGRVLSPGLLMAMRDLPEFSEKNFPVEPIKSDELLRRAKSSFPIYAFGYNWLESNSFAAKNLKERIEKVISKNDTGAFTCNQVILVTHSMGGLVARACSQLSGMSEKIVGIVHGVMPSTGAAVAYRRCKVGMRDEDFKAGLVIGSSGKEVAAVFAQSPGALQLLPSVDYGFNWLKVQDSSSKTVLSLPASDPYEEIYLQKDKWWGLIREEWLRPKNGNPIDWDDFCKNVRLAKEFHRRISKHYHRNTYVFYGGGVDKSSFSNISWTMKKGMQPDDSSLPPTVDKVLNLNNSEIRTNGFNVVYVGGRAIANTVNRSDTSVVEWAETSHWEIRCGPHDSAGDGTVPACSGKAPRSNGGKSILQQFELSGIEHEPAYSKYLSAQQVTYYAVTKLAALADVS